MKTIRTEYYLDISDPYARRMPNRNPGIAVAWFGIGDHAIDEDDLRTILKFSRVRRTGELPNFIHGSLYGRYPSYGRPLVFRKGVSSLVKRLARQRIIVERSPVESIPLRQLLKGSAAVVVGTFIGLGIAQDNPYLMLISIPGGIIAVGSAIGISRGLENGLNKAIEALITGEKPPQPRGPRKRKQHPRIGFARAKKSGDAQQRRRAARA